MKEGRKFLSIMEAIERVTSRRVSPATCHRWISTGLNGIVLESWMLGGRRFTTVEAVQRFVEARSERQCTSVAAAAAPPKYKNIAEIMKALNKKLDGSKKEVAK